MKPVSAISNPKISFAVSSQSFCFGKKKKKTILNFNFFLFFFCFCGKWLVTLLNSGAAKFNILHKDAGIFENHRNYFDDEKHPRGQKVTAYLEKKNKVLGEKFP